MVAGYCFQLVEKDTGAVVAIIAQVRAVAATIVRTSATVGQGGLRKPPRVSGISSSNIHGRRGLDGQDSLGHWKRSR